MADEHKIEAYRKAYEAKTDEQLLHEIGRWVSSSEPHIAAKQEMHRRQRIADQTAADENRAYHREGMQQEKRLHRRTQAVAWIAVGVSLVGAVFAALSFFRDLRPDSFATAGTPTPPALTSPQPRNDRSSPASPAPSPTVAPLPIPATPAPPTPAPAKPAPPKEPTAPPPVNTETRSFADPL